MIVFILLTIWFGLGLGAWFMIRTQLTFIKKFRPVEIYSVMLPLYTVLGLLSFMSVLLFILDERRNLKKDTIVKKSKFEIKGVHKNMFHSSNQYKHFR